MQHGGDYWIGLNSYQKAGAWKWTDNSEVSWINWRRGHPQQGRNVQLQDCVVLTGRNTMMDISCGMTRPFLCKKKGKKVAVEVEI